jgi:SAM-dependent methyltransferase
MVFEFLRLNIDVTDDYFNSIYPEEISSLARKHWTSVTIAKAASEYLVERPGTRVLDIGSGAGKFCLIGASHTKGYFTGVEQRFELVALSRKIAKQYTIRNTEFINENINAIDFKNYDSFYFFNSFYENIDTLNRIDDKVHLDMKLYHQYSTYVVEQFLKLPLGARLVTYCSPFTIIPSCFELQYSISGGALRFWEKVDN